MLAFCHMRAALTLILLPLLTACADVPLPSWLTGEPPANVLNAPRVVGTPPSQNVKGWPNLSTVPDKPQDFTPSGDRREVIEEMSKDKGEAETIRERLPTSSHAKVEDS